MLPMGLGHGVEQAPDSTGMSRFQHQIQRKPNQSQPRERALRKIREWKRTGLSGCALATRFSTPRHTVQLLQHRQCRGTMRILETGFLSFNISKYIYIYIYIYIKGV